MHSSIMGLKNSIDTIVPVDQFKPTFKHKAPVTVELKTQSVQFFLIPVASGNEGSHATILLTQRWITRLVE